jgi:hypothetical protein
MNPLAAASRAAQDAWVAQEAALRWLTACPLCDRPRALPNPKCPEHPTR